VDCGKIFSDLGDARRFITKMFLGALFEGDGKQIALEAPRRSPGICK